MDQHQFVTVARSLTGLPSRRHLLHGLAGAGLVLGVARWPEAAEAKKKRRPKRRTGLCRKNGSACARPGKTCQQRYCLNAPFTIEASWPEQAGNAIVLFLPPQNATTGPAPYIHDGCKPDEYDCEGTYPFACLDGDAQSAGDEITTIHRLLPGRYEYWVDLYAPSPAGVVTVAIEAANGRDVRAWTNPSTAALDSSAWRVFDVDGGDGRVIPVDALAEGPMPDAAHDPSTSLCAIG